MTQRITALVGAQFGSEGKGLIAEKICKRYDFHVRTGAPNAGHTYFVYGPTGERVKVVARSIPCGAANPDACLVIGAGGLIDPHLLIEEARSLSQVGASVAGRLVVDSKCGIIDPERHHAWEGGVNGNAHHAIGSTGEGVGPARMAKIARGTMPHPAPGWARFERVGDGDWAEVLADEGIEVDDTARLLNDAIDRGASVLLEGTQGSGLSLTHGPWPFVTSSDTNAAQLASDAGIAPQMVSDTILVARTYPIRVAGRSGPLPGETSWEALGLPEERTTVTKKVRRVAFWTNPLVRRAIMLNRPNEIALTFADYTYPEIAGLTDMDEVLRAVSDPEQWLDDLDRLEQSLGIYISMLGTGPDSLVVNDGRYRRPSGVFLNSDETLERLAGWPSDRQAYGDVEAYAGATR